MKNEDLLAALRAAHEEAKAEERDDARWVARQQGRLTPDEEAELRAAAEGDPQVQHMLVSTQPVTEEFAERIAAGALAARGGQATGVDGQTQGKVLNFPNARRRAAAVVTTVAMIAAAAAIALWPRPAPMAGDLPEYALLVEGKDRPTRGVPEDVGDESRFVVSRGGYIDIIARPAHAVTASIGARAFLVRGGEGRAVAGELTVNDVGTVHLEGQAAVLFGDAAGVWDLVMFVGPRDALPSTGAGASALAHGNRRDVRVLRRTIEIRD